ncbi:MAG: helix-turn-helix domain-containing protein [Peptostreptococcaceae bacterium]|nr:helix-turn-helix domain-containing protein [Peptostreptococcaceae bacterium]
MINIRKVGRPRKLTVEQQQTIYEQRKNGFRIEELAIEYNVSSSTIIRAIRRIAV